VVIIAVVVNGATTTPSRPPYCANDYLLRSVPIGWPLSSASGGRDGRNTHLYIPFIDFSAPTRVVLFVSAVTNSNESRPVAAECFEEDATEREGIKKEQKARDNGDSRAVGRVHEF
jgi:hypothetical protein